MSTIFYSWQNDTDAKVNRHFIKDALEKAMKNVSKGLDIEETLRLDHDTKDVSGSPDIVNTILRKIDECSMFIADLTIVANTEKKSRCRIPTF
jgi:hypothetical protein